MGLVLALDVKPRFLAIYFIDALYCLRYLFTCLVSVDCKAWNGCSAIKIDSMKLSMHCSWANMKAT